MQRKIVIPLIGGLVLVVLVGAGISFQLAQTKPSDRAAQVTASPVASPSLSPTPSPVAGAGGAVASEAAGAYKDGTYQSDGSYRTPAGTETIGVNVTVKDSMVTAVTVTPKGKDPQSRQHEERFAAGISSVVVGKPLDEADSIGKINGSSLTGSGFNTAIQTIQGQAKQG